MRISGGRRTCSPTDLANFIACRQKTAVDLAAARGHLRPPDWEDPLAERLRARGQAHEDAYVARLLAEGRGVTALSHGKDESREAALEATRHAMRDGADIIVQAALGDDHWFGYADVLARVDRPSDLGSWSYEVRDTKLARDTRGGTILQLCVYTELVAAWQGLTPEFFRVVTPIAVETYRVADFAAYYRLVKRRFFEALDDEAATLARVDHVPSPAEHCEVCRWWLRCNAQRRKADHLSFVANLGRTHEKELEKQGVTSLAELARMPLPIAFKPERGAKATYEQLREQARLQLEQRENKTPMFELLPSETDFGLAALPAPSAGDMFLDLEGARFAREGGREYLFGLGRVNADGAWEYVGHWAFTDEDEALAFERVMDAIRQAIARDPGAHVYHFAPYEPAAFKRLMGRYATRAVELDDLLRGERFVDLLAVVRQALRAGVESYSIKSLEPFYAFTRTVELGHAGDQRRLIEDALDASEVQAIGDDIRAAVQGYNEDDCRSTLELRNWLERLRDGQIAKGVDVPRPETVAAAASPEVSERQARLDDLRGRLLARTKSAGDHAEAFRLLAYLIDWHYREDKVTWWEYFRLREMADDDLVDEPWAVTHLRCDEALGPWVSPKTGRATKSFVYRFSYPPQECEIRAGAALHSRSGAFGEVLEADRSRRTFTVKTTQADLPSSVFAFEHINPGVLSDAVCRCAEQVLTSSSPEGLDDRPAMSLLLRQPPRLADGAAIAAGPRAGETTLGFATRIVAELRNTVLPIQGPPGSGKTYVGARMIVELVRAGRRVGVAATSHKVVANLLEAVVDAAEEAKTPIRIGQRNNDADDVRAGFEALTKNEDAIEAMRGGRLDILGGTPFFWAREDCERLVDVLVVDEAGQMSLANAIAVAGAAQSLVLLGDPRQLQQPQKGSHPDGVGVSALDHILGDHETMPPDRGLFLAETWRLAPPLCAATSELFYEGKLTTAPGVERVRIDGAGPFEGAGIWCVGVAHDGCRNASDEEVEAVAGLVEGILSSGARWTDARGCEHQVGEADILVIAPFNAHVNRVDDRLRSSGRTIRVGTVDKFQGQEAPVVIYTMATSSPDEAPRGLEFLYSANRLNVATSRAKAAAIIVASPKLFAPDCKTPKQMTLANALCRLKELAR